MHAEEKLTYESWPAEPERSTLEAKNKFTGFWLFLGGETVLFSSLFATYLALKDKVPDSSMPLAKDLFELPLTFVATMLLLTSSLTSVYAIYQMKNFNFKKMMLWFGITALLGAAFLGSEVYEFTNYVHEGHKFTSSAFGSAFYTLVGFHGGHVAFGLMWCLTLMIRNAKRGLNLYNAPKFYVFSLYWHFIDVVWVFIFSVVYLMGMVG
ncbi:cytochrome (ubi)quinol oxidase subunit III [Neobacillus dielmonensis]|uniref:cytochrome (ubi)quinol oxidase subunit III n=1 Tax=Neobacillus dielmonensis TaxID=1347369 RepID=UPI0005A66EA8|nr:cytochrome (ubi)quinol oxidase subunit III [Neobacillus dielmonensis]